MMAASMQPSVLVAGACKQLPVASFVAELISPTDDAGAPLCKKQLPGEMATFDHADAFEWLLDTKYYTASINVCACKARVVPPSRDFADTVEAVVLLFDGGDDGTSFEEARRWNELIDNLYSPSLKILVCESIPTTDVHAFSPFDDDFNDAGNSNGGPTSRRDFLLNWCIENEFELVELNPLTPDEDDAEDLAFCTDAAKGSNYGFARIRSALKAHMWSNLRLKPTTVSLPAAMMLNREFGCDVQTTVVETQGADNRQPTVEEALTQVHIADIGRLESNAQHDVAPTIADVSTGDNNVQLSSLAAEPSVEPDGNPDADDNDDESFENMFARLREAKNQAEGLADEERRRYAEQVTCEFWRAIGGNEDEIAGGESDEN